MRDVLGLRPIMGYNSWNDCASNVSETHIKSVARGLITTGLAAKGYTLVDVDEGWLAGRSPDGLLYEDRERFPSGMRALGDWVHAQVVPQTGARLRYGLYHCRGPCQCATTMYAPKAFVKGIGAQGFEEADARWLVAQAALACTRPRRHHAHARHSSKRAVRSCRGTGHRLPEARLVL